MSRGKLEKNLSHIFHGDFKNLIKKYLKSEKNLKNLRKNLKNLRKNLKNLKKKKIPNFQKKSQKSQNS